MLKVILIFAGSKFLDYKKKFGIKSAFFVHGYYFFQHGFVFSNYFLKKLVFCLSVFRVLCLFCLEFDVIFADFLYNICVNIVYIGTKCSVVLISPRFF